MLLAHQVTGGSVKVQHAGRGGLDAHLVLDGCRIYCVALTQLAVFEDQGARNEEQADSFHPGRGAVLAREHHVNDIFRQVMITGGDENLGPGDLKAAVTIGHCLGVQQPQVGATVGLGEAHGAGPCACHHVGQIPVFQSIRCLRCEQMVRAVRQFCIQLERDIAGPQHFVDQELKQAR